MHQLAMSSPQVVSTGRVQDLALALLPGDPGDPHQPLAEDALVFQELALQLTSPHPLHPTDRLGAGGKAQSGVWGGLAPDRRQRTAGTQPPASTAPQWLRNPLPGWAEGACYWAETSHCSRHLPGLHILSLGWGGHRRVGSEAGARWGGGGRRLILHCPRASTTRA